jgi:hypothetical protein
VTDDDTPNFGPCCVCETTEGVTNLVMLDRRGATPGQGWGCTVCGLPSDGAMAVVCDACVGLSPRFACRGYATELARIPIKELPEGKFEHDAQKHRQDDLANLSHDLGRLLHERTGGNLRNCVTSLCEVTAEIIKTADDPARARACFITLLDQFMTRPNWLFERDDADG